MAKPRVRRVEQHNAPVVARDHSGSMHSCAESNARPGVGNLAAPGAHIICLIAYNVIRCLPWQVGFGVVAIRQLNDLIDG